MVVKIVEVAKVEINMVKAARSQALTRMTTPPAKRLGSYPVARILSKAACNSAGGNAAISIWAECKRVWVRRRSTAAKTAPMSKTARVRRRKTPESFPRRYSVRETGLARTV